MRASGPVAIRTGTLIRKTGCRGPFGTAAARHVIRWNRKALLVEDLLHQVGGGLGECELAEARVDGGEVGVDDLVEGVVLHGVSFRTPAWFLVFLSSSASCGASLLVVFFASFFCCAFTIGRPARVRHAAIDVSIAKSSAHLEEDVSVGGGCPFIRMLVPVSAGVAQHEAVVGRAVRGNGWADQVDGSLVDAVAAVHAQVGAGHVGGRVAGEEQDRAGDLVVGAEAAHGHDLEHRVVSGHVDASVEDA